VTLGNWDLLERAHIAAAITAWLALSGFVTDPAHADGTVLFSENCAACHGDHGEGNPELRAPVIAGLDKTYLGRQVEHFLNGMRPVPADNTAAAGMVEVLRGLDAANIEAITAYVAGLPAPVLNEPTSAMTFRMRGLFSGCMSCHQAQGEGNATLSTPRIAHQYGWYLKEQLLAFRSGKRGNDPADKYGKQMRTMALDVASDADIDQLVAYIQKLGK
jgi:cytochrome c553